jgi:3-phenylpropionate/trans-cinnamate dioxygenase ferredoxin subunit
VFNYTRNDPLQLTWVEIALLAEVQTGERLFITVDERAIVLFNIAGHIFAIGDVCSHDGGPLGDGEIDKEEVICPRHGGRFDLLTGKAMGLPALVDIPAYPIRISNEKILLGLPRP